MVGSEVSRLPQSTQVPQLKDRERTRLNRSEVAVATSATPAPSATFLNPAILRVLRVLRVSLRPNQKRSGPPEASRLLPLPAPDRHFDGVPSPGSGMI